MQGEEQLKAIFRLAPYLTPLAWAAFSSWLIFGLMDWWGEKRKPYRQILLAAKGDGLQGRNKRDSRGLSRAVRVVGRGARMMHVEQPYWDRLDRRLSLMGEKTGAQELVTILLLRSMLVSLPILAAPLLLDGWWASAFYPLAAAVVFRQELKEWEGKYERWQKALVRDIPQVMDRLRICFAGGRDYLSALRQAQASGGQAMGQALGQLILDIQSIGSSGAFRLFSVSFDMPAIHKLASAMMLAVESGYGAAEAYFNSIEEELAILRQEAAESLIRARPEKVYRLYALLFGLAVAALLLKGWEILQQVGLLFS
jgi:hypothetical protein